MTPTIKYDLRKSYYNLPVEVLLISVFLQENLYNIVDPKIFHNYLFGLLKQWKLDPYKKQTYLQIPSIILKIINIKQKTF